MSEYSWTYVKEKALPQSMRDAKCAEMMTSLSQRWYLRVSYEEWRDQLTKVLSKHLDDESIKKETTKAKYNKIRSQTLKDIATLEKIKAGKASFRELSTDARDSAQFRFYGKNVYDKAMYVLVPEECFRLRRCIEGKKFDTVDSLLQLIKDPENSGLLYWGEDRHGWSEELEHTIKDFYGQFGDGNFFVEFG